MNAGRRNPTALLTDLPRPTALVLGAGEQNCVAGAAMLEVVLADGWRPDLAVGSSGGALTVAVLATSPDQAPQVATALWREIATSRAAQPGLPRVARAAAGGEGQAITKTWVALLEPYFGDLLLDDTGCTLVATNLSRQTPLTIDTGPVLDAVLMAAAHPVLTNPVLLDNGDVVIDGGFAAPQPVLQALAAGAKSIVVLDTGRPEPHISAVPPARWYRVVLAAVRAQLDSKASLDVAAAALSVPIIVLSAAEPGWVQWDQCDERLDAGRLAAADQLAKLDARWSKISAAGVYTAADEVRLDRRLAHRMR